MHHRRTLLVWVVLLVFAGYQSVHDRHDLSDTFAVPNPDSQDALTLLSNQFPAPNAATAVSMKPPRQCGVQGRAI
ncbi:MAG: hypothetical protein EXQ71_06440 [Acidimicrobiia bacterium]|nr:hypothetical protein [Acidimicrobiia bacterium]